MKMRRKIKILISGGGTGGHVFPAIAIADALRKRDEAINILFVGADHKMEMDRVPAAGYSIIGLPVTGFQRRLTCRNLSFFFRLILSMVKARKILKSFIPDVVVGVGGYASGPVVRAAASKGIPVLIQEQNSYAGVTNRLLARTAERICVAYEGMERYFPSDKIVVTGNPVREDLTDISGKREEACDFFGIKGSGKVMLVIGGSLGAGSINRAVSENIHKIVKSGIELIWQTGGNGFSAAKKLQDENILEGVHIYDFITRMDLAYSVADLVICRAGAITVSELCLTGKPAILVPSPNVAEDHQTKNALKLVEKNAALLVRDSEPGEILISAAIDLAGNRSLLQELKKNISGMAQPGSAGIIADEVLKLVKIEACEY